jgi:ATP-dependent Clp protease adaptor protein ClpS
MSTDIAVKERTRIKISEPKKWSVIILNDDHTSFEFVISMLIQVFNHSIDSANEVTKSVHEQGAGVAGVYDFEIAEVKAVEATKMARENGFPLQIKIESEG